MLPNLIFLLYLSDVILPNIQLYKRDGNAQDIVWVGWDILEQLIADESDCVENRQLFTSNVSSVWSIILFHLKLCGNEHIKNENNWKMLPFLIF